MRDVPEVIRDPVHNLIPLSGEEGAMIAELFDRPEFQRLRRIRQLGLGFLTYPGAEHSRWVHSLGVCHVARRMLDALRTRHGDPSAQYAELASLRKEILAAALLHDVGHGPFSHVFERAIPRVTDPPNDYPKDHEDWSLQIVRERFDAVLRKHGVKPDIVVGLIDKTNRQHLLAKDFINSQLDADRIDYLLRDSRVTGTRCGDFDLEWLLHSLRVGKVRVKGHGEGVWRLCFSSRKAIHVIEEYIQAREFMYLQVYVHKTTRAYEALLKNILGLAAAITAGDPSKAPTGCPQPLAKMLAQQTVSTDEYLSLDDFRLWCCLADWSDLGPQGDARFRRLAAMCRRLVNREQPYQTIDLHGRVRQDRALELVTELRGTDGEFSCYRDAFMDQAYRSALYRKSKEGGEEEEDRVIYFLDEEGLTHPAESESDVLKAISNIETAIYRLYYDETDENLMERLRSEGWVKNEVQEQEGWVGHEGL